MKPKKNVFFSNKKKKEKTQSEEEEEKFDAVGASRKIKNWRNSVNAAERRI